MPPTRAPIPAQNRVPTPTQAPTIFKSKPVFDFKTEGLSDLTAVEAARLMGRIPLNIEQLTIYNTEFGPENFYKLEGAKYTMY